MQQILSLTTPLYLIIALGYLAVRFGVFEKEQMGVFGRFLLLVILPALVFRAIAQHPLAEVLNFHYFVVYALASLLAHGLGFAYARWFAGKSRAEAALFGMGMGTSNSVFVGYPIIEQLIGAPAGIALALCLLVENLIMIPLTLVLGDSREDLPWQRALWQSLKSLVRNPIFIGILAGLACSASGLALPRSLERTLQLISNGAAVVALFMIGGVLVGRRIEGWGKGMSAIVVGKLLIHPLLVLLLLLVLPPFDPILQSAALLFACMPIPAIYPAIALRYRFDGFCAAALVLVTVVSFFSINFWLTVQSDVMRWVGR